MILKSQKPTYEQLAQRVLELEKAEEVLKGNVNPYQRLIENSPDMIYRMSLPEGKYEYVSPAATGIFGYPPEAWYDNPFFIREILHPDWLSYFDAQLENLLKGQVAPICEYKIIHKDQSVRWINQRNVLMKNDAGYSEAIVGIVTDITDSKLAELLLQKSEERFSLVMEAAKDGLWDWNVNSDEVYFSPGYSAMMGYASSEISNHVSSWMDLIHPEDIDAVLKANRDCIKNRREQFEVEFRMQAKNGEWRWILGRGKAVARDRNGLATRMIGTHIDITERKLAEELLREERWRLENIIEGTSGGTWEWNVQTEELLVNEIWAKLLGYTRDELSPFSYKKWKAMVHPDDLKQSCALLEQHFAGDLSYYNCEIRMKQKEGRWMWIQDSGRLITRTADGKPLMMFGIHTDITDRKLAEQALLQSKKEWERTFDSMPDMIAILDDRHHILRTNLAMANRLGCTSRQCIGQVCYTSVHGESEPPEFCPHAQAMADGKEHMAELYEERLGGFFLVSATPLFDDQGKLIGSVHVARDITDRKIQENKLRKLNRTLMALSHGREVMMRATDESAHLGEICNIIVKDCGYAMVWIGYAEKDAAKSVRPMVSCGFDDGYLESLNITWADNARGRGPTGTAIRTGRVSTCSNMTTDPDFAPWREDALKRGYASSLVLPLVADEQSFGAITIYSGAPDSFTEDEIKLLTELADDLAYGIMSLRLRIERTRSEEILRSLLTEKEVLLKEVHHRVKNNLQVISSLISLQSDSLHEEKMQLILSDLRNRVHSMALVHEKLYRSEDMSKLNFAEYAASLLNYLWRAGVATAHNVHLNLSFAPLMLSINSAVHCGLILNELVTNALKYAFPGDREGELSVSVEHDPAAGAVCLRVSDNGVGLPADFDLRQSSTLGLRLVQMLAGQMRGTVQTGFGPGTEFQIRFNVKKEGRHECSRHSDR